MYLFDLQAKLKKANPELYVQTDKAITAFHEIKSHPLMLRFGKRYRGFSNIGKHYMDNDTQRYMEMKENGQAGEYICGVSAYSPEYDRFNLDTGVLEVRGWRSVAMFLVKKGICSLDQARKAFECSSLGTTMYDKADYDKKLKWARE